MNAMQETAELAMQPQPEMIAQALAVIRPHGAILLVSIHPMTRAIVAQSFVMPLETQAAVDWAVAQNEKQAGVYFTVNITTATHKKSTKADVVQAVAFWSDCDPEVFKFKGYDTARADLLTNVVPRMQKHASYIIDSGNGVDPFFTLDTPMTLDGDYAQYEAVNQQVGEVCGGPGTYNCDRVMRLPGTLNFPNDAKIKKGYPQVPSMARMLYVSDKKYTLQEVQALVISLELQNRFERFLNENITAATRYAGDASGLTDKSGSAMDFSMVALLKIGGFSLEECIALLANWNHGSSSEQRNGDRYWSRCWERTEVKQQPPAVDFSELLKTKKIAKPQQQAEASTDETELIAPPGMLGAITQFVNATARKPQPMFAVQTAIAVCATVLGRRFVTTQRNWPSLYCLNIGLSASGKEHAKSAAETLLESFGMGTLIGPSSYTSNAGVLSALHKQPTHLTVIDEFGKELEQASIRGNQRAQSTIKTLIEIWGRCDGVLRPQGYSTFGMTEEESKRMFERLVRNPALTMLAMSTPETFFESVGSAAARDGFLNRFLIVESDIGRQPNNMVTPIPVPAAVIDWAKAMHEPAKTQLVDPATCPDLEPSPVVIPIADDAMALFRNFDAECIEFMGRYEQYGLAEMFGRTNEISMRLALIVAAGKSTSGFFTVDKESARWAINYARYHAVRTANRLQSSVHDSEFEAAKKQVYNLLVKRGEKGMTVAEIDRSSKRFRGMPQRQQVELLNSLAHVGQAAQVVQEVKLGRFKTRTVWVAIAQDSDIE